jgi:UDP-glucose:(heptosyl)LPS alpha-1,3-glucosyltransferase
MASLSATQSAQVGTKGNRKSTGDRGMNIAFCYESVLPARGGCETYISDLARRLAADGHEVHLYACRWDEESLPSGLHFHRLAPVSGPRFLRPWRFAAACEEALRTATHDVTIGFDKTWGQDVLYPQGGLHVASIDHNLHKYRNPMARAVMHWVKKFDPANLSFRLLERRQYLSKKQPLIIVNSNMVRQHFTQYYGITAETIHVIRAAIDMKRFTEQDRPRRRLELRRRWGVDPSETVALFAAMNYRLKGLEPLIHAMQLITDQPGFRLVVLGNPRTARYERLARRLGVSKQVLFAGHCQEMRNAYFAADFLVHPTFYDPCSLVVLEALACGLPVVTSSFNGASELLSPLGEGFVVNDPHDAGRLAWCMRQLLDPIRRGHSAQAARRTAARWTFEHHYQQMLRVFGEAAARRKAA